jgi:hypothetical protein
MLPIDVEFFKTLDRNIEANEDESTRKSLFGTLFSRHPVRRIYDLFMAYRIFCDGAVENLRCYR